MTPAGMVGALAADWDSGLSLHSKHGQAETRVEGLATRLEVCAVRVSLRMLQRLLVINPARVDRIHEHATVPPHSPGPEQSNTSVCSPVQYSTANC